MEFGKASPAPAPAPRRETRDLLLTSGGSELLSWSRERWRCHQSHQGIMEKHGANSALTAPLPPAKISFFFSFFPEFSHVAGVESCLQEEDFCAEKLLSSSSVGVYKSSALPSPQPGLFQQRSRPEGGENKIPKINKGKTFFKKGFHKLKTRAPEGCRPGFSSPSDREFCRKSFNTTHMKVLASQSLLRYPGQKLPLSSPFFNPSSVG